MKDSFKNLIVSKFDYTTNDYPGLTIRSFPTINLYIQGRKNAPITYEGELELNNVKSWTEQYIIG